MASEDNNVARRSPTIADAKDRVLVVTPTGVEGRLIGVKLTSGKAKVLIGNRHFTFLCSELEVVKPTPESSL